MSKHNYEIPQAIIERDVYCPYCKENGAFLISDMAEYSDTLQLPEVGCTNAALMGCTCGCWGLVKGYPLIERKKHFTYRTYGFCPHCGNIYYAEKPQEKESLDSKTMAVLKNKVSGKSDDK